MARWSYSTANSFPPPVLRSARQACRCVKFPGFPPRSRKSSPSGPSVHCALAIAAVFGMPAVLASCTNPGTTPSFQSSNPDARLAAIQAAAQTANQRAIPDLIAQLSSEDPAVRFFAIRTLERLTSQTFGYDHAAPRGQRQEAISAWVEWSERRDQSPSSPKASTAPEPRES